MFDLMGLIQQIAHKEEDLLCGGRHHLYFESFNKFFRELKGCGATLVFFSDLNVQKFKVDEWLRRRDSEYNETVNLFDQIEEGMSLRDIIATRDNPKTLMTAMSALKRAAKANGECHTATQHECDAELAKYACEHKAMAVIGDDTDFLIFEGDWRYWSAKDIDFDTLKTIEYDRTVLRKNLGLSYQQLPLFATLLSNDFTKSYYDELRSFHRNLGHMGKKFQNVADYVRRFRQSTFKLSPSDIQKIGEQVFGTWYDEERYRAISDSIQSYNVNFTVTELTDPLMIKAAEYNSNVYNQLLDSIKTATLTMYDMRCRDIAKIYTEVMTILLRKNVGVAWQSRNPNLSFQLLAKWSHSENFRSNIVKPIYPPDRCKCLSLI